MKIKISPRPCPGCENGSVRFQYDKVDIVDADHVIAGRCDSCGETYIQPFKVEQQYRLIPLKKEKK